MYKRIVSLICITALSGCYPNQQVVTKTKSAIKIETVGKLPFRPGNVSVTQNSRVFSTVHPFSKEKNIQLFEVTGLDTYRAWPSSEYQSSNGNYNESTIDSPLGITKDKQGGLWIVDMGFHLGKTRIWGFDIKSESLLYKIDIPIDVAPPGSFAQDLVVDRENGWVYLADIANPGILAVELATQKARRFGDHPSLAPEKNAEMIINDQKILFDGKPASIGIDPITLSDDGETIFFGAMSGISWYSVPSKLFRAGASDEIIANNIKYVGKKPISDGAATDHLGNHFFTNLNENGIDKLDINGLLTPIVRDDRFDWSDNVSADGNGWLYVVVNQLHKSPPFTGGEDAGQAPYYIYRLLTDTE